MLEKEKPVFILTESQLGRLCVIGDNGITFLMMNPSC